MQAEVSGTVVRVLAENGKPVSPGVVSVMKGLSACCYALRAAKGCTEGGLAASAALALI